MRFTRLPVLALLVAGFTTAHLTPYDIHDIYARDDDIYDVYARDVQENLHSRDADYDEAVLAARAYARALYGRSLYDSAIDKRDIESEGKHIVHLMMIQSLRY